MITKPKFVVFLVLALPAVFSSVAYSQCYLSRGCKPVTISPTLRMEPDRFITVMVHPITVLGVGPPTTAT